MRCNLDIWKAVAQEWRHFISMERGTEIAEKVENAVSDTTALLKKMGTDQAIPSAKEAIFQDPDDDDWWK